MTTTQNTTGQAPRETALAKMKTFTARQSTQVLCEAVVTLAGLPRTPETNLTRAVMLGILCERHPEADAAAETWAESDTAYDPDDYAAVIVGAALTVIGG